VKKVLTCRRKTKFGQKTFVWDASTAKKHNEAYQSYFNLMCELGEYSSTCLDFCALQLFDKARVQNNTFARAFVSLMEGRVESDLCLCEVENSEDERPVVSVRIEP
jgi:hypothetical protein